jgi:hypothetical protein
MKTTIDMAREAGLHIPYWGEEEDPKKDPPRWTMVSPLPPLLKAFEALVRADERERLAKIQFESILQAIKIEREACAKVCFGFEGADPLGVSLDCAAAIRARRST